MKRLSLVLTIFIVVALVSPWRGLASPKNLSYKLDGITVEGLGDSLLVSVSWTFLDWGVEDTKAVVFDMSVKHGDNERQLRPVTVYGRRIARSASVYRASGRNDEIQVVDLSRRLSLTCESVLPYEPWMDTVKILLAVKEWDGRRSLTIRSSGQKGCFAKPACPSLAELEWNVVEPGKDARDYRLISFSEPVSFEEGSQKFDVGFGGNRESMTRLVAKLRTVTSTNRYLLRNAKLELFSSPSSASSENRRFSSSRLQSLYSYLQKSGAFLTSQPKREYGGEDWDGVAGWISESHYGDDARLMEIVCSEASTEERVRLISGEKPAAWDDLVADCFPSLGRVSFTAEFKPQSFQAPRYARNMYDEIPELLTPHDFWYVSTMYSKGSEEWMEVMLTGADLNPGSEALSCNAVFGLVAAGAPRQASAYLRNVGDSPDGRYARALWLYAMGRYAECADILDSLENTSMFFRSVYENVVPFIDWTLNYLRWEKVDL